MSIPKISVIIPVYGVEKHIGKCARSLFDSTLDDIEFIFVDDKSKDRSMEFLSDVISKYPERNVRVIHHKENCGIACARETGLGEATGEYIAWCDSDDYVEKSMYEKMYECAKREDAEIVCCNVFVETNNGTSALSFPSNGLLPRNDFLHIYNWGGIYGALWNKIVKRDLYHDLHFVKGINMWEDSSMTIQTAFKANRIFVLDERLYHYNRIVGNSLIRGYKQEKTISMIKVVERMECFFRMQAIAEKNILDFIGFLKIHATENILRYPSYENVALWKRTFPEKRRYFLLYPLWTFPLKARACIIDLLPAKIGTLLLGFMKSGTPFRI